MPIYEYRCSVCGERFEKLVRTTSAPIEVRCPSCNAEKVDRQVSVFGFASGGGSSLDFSSSGSSCAPTGG